MQLDALPAPEIGTLPTKFHARKKWVALFTLVEDTKSMYDIWPSGKLLLIVTERHGNMGY